VGGGTLIQTIVVVAAVDGRFGVTTVVSRQMVFMSNPPPTYVATLVSMCSVRLLVITDLVPTSFQKILLNTICQDQGQIKVFMVDVIGILPVSICQTMIRNNAGKGLKTLRCSTLLIGNKGATYSQCRGAVGVQKLSWNSLPADQRNKSNTI